MTDEITPQSDNWRIGTPSRNGLKANTKLMTQTDALLMSRGFAPLANDRERCIAIAASMKTVRDDIKGLAGALALAIPIFYACFRHTSTVLDVAVPALAIFIALIAAVLIYRDNGSAEAVAAVLEARAR